jgi:microcystin-dependent protein
MKKRAWLPLAVVCLTMTGFSISGCTSPTGNDGPFALSVVDAGSGSGAVTTAVAGATTQINCVSGSTTDCSAEFDSASVVTLTAKPAGNSSFVGWTGACTGTTLTCDVTMSQAQTVAAQFNIANDPVQVMFAGSGQGSVTSTPAGISCGNYSGAPTQCSETVEQTDMITLTEAPQAGSTFTGWSVSTCPSTSTTCQVDVTQAVSVTATFTAIELSAPLVTTIAEGGLAQGQVGALAMNYYIAAYGIYPSSGGGANTSSTPYVGQVMLFAGNFAPAGWLPCDGSLLQISQYDVLFNLLGTTYGGNGTTTFAVPDLRGRAAMGVGALSGGTSVTTGAGTSEVSLVSSLAEGATSQGQILSQGIGYYVATQGIFPSSGSAGTSGGAYLGEIVMFAFGPASVPAGYAPCNGELLPISTNTALFSILGTTYGGNGTTNFALPNLSGRVPMGMGTLANPSNPAASSTEVPLVSSIALGATAQGQIGVQGLNYEIQTQGIFPSTSGSSASNGFVAEIVLFAGNFSAGGWLPCQGQTLSISSNAAFFSLVGTTYGGNATSTFGVPDLRGRIVVGSN